MTYLNNTAKTYVSSYRPSINVQNRRVFSNREMIPQRNDVLWRIESGVVRTLTWSEDGTYTTLGYWGKGDVVGYPLSKIEPYQIECLTMVETTLLAPHLWHQDVNNLISHIQQIEELLSIVHRKSVNEKIWLFLLWLGEKFGRDVTQGKLIELNVTHQEIAEVLNTTRVTVTRIAKQLEEQGKIVRYKRRIILT